MKVLYLIYHGFSSYSGISKKIIAQVNGLKQNGHEVHVCTYTIDKDGYRKRMIDEHIIQNFGTGILAKIKKRCCYGAIVKYAREQHIDLVYARSFHNANPFTILLFKKLRQRGIKTVIEIPTYPYDPEYVGADWRVQLGLKIDRIFRHKLASQVKAIVTFSDEECIFGQKTIKISNGIDFSTIPLRTPTTHSSKELHLIGVAEVHYWHGYDRLIHGLGEFYKTSPKHKVYFHLVGGVAPSEMYDTPQAPGFATYIQKYGIEKYIIFHGQLFGKDLDDVFNLADFAIGSLARHRTHIDKIKTLKNREYAARGIPFVYSETDDDFENMSYILKAPADESPIDIQKIIDFHNRQKMSPSDIRNSIQNLSWEEQMRIVVNKIFES